MAAKVVGAVLAERAPENVLKTYSYWWFVRDVARWTDAARFVSRFGPRTGRPLGLALPAPSMAVTTQPL